MLDPATPRSQTATGTSCPTARNPRRSRASGDRWLGCRLLRMIDLARVKSGRTLTAAPPIGSAHGGDRRVRPISGQQRDDVGNWFERVRESRRVVVPTADEVQPEVAREPDQHDGCADREEPPATSGSSPADPGTGRVGACLPRGRVTAAAPFPDSGHRLGAGRCVTCRAGSFAQRRGAPLTQRPAAKPSSVRGRGTHRVWRAPEPASLRVGSRRGLALGARPLSTHSPSPSPTSGRQLRPTSENRRKHR